MNPITFVYTSITSGKNSSKTPLIQSTFSLNEELDIASWIIREIGKKGDNPDIMAAGSNSGILASSASLVYTLSTKQENRNVLSTDFIG